MIALLALLALAAGEPGAGMRVEPPASPRQPTLLVLDADPPIEELRWERLDDPRAELLGLLPDAPAEGPPSVAEERLRRALVRLWPRTAPTAAPTVATDGGAGPAERPWPAARGPLLGRWSQPCAGLEPGDCAVPLDGPLVGFQHVVARDRAGRIHELTWDAGGLTLLAFPLPSGHLVLALDPARSAAVPEAQLEVAGGPREPRRLLPASPRGGWEVPAGTGAVLAHAGAAWAHLELPRGRIEPRRSGALLLPSGRTFAPPDRIELLAQTLEGQRFMAPVELRLEDALGDEVVSGRAELLTPNLVRGALTLPSGLRPGPGRLTLQWPGGSASTEVTLLAQAEAVLTIEAHVRAGVLEGQLRDASGLPCAGALQATFIAEGESLPRRTELAIGPEGRFSLPLPTDLLGVRALLDAVDAHGRSGQLELALGRPPLALRMESPTRLLAPGRSTTLHISGPPGLRCQLEGSSHAPGRGLDGELPAAQLLARATTTLDPLGEARFETPPHPAGWTEWFARCEGREAVQVLFAGAAAGDVAFTPAHLQLEVDALAVRGGPMRVAVLAPFEEGSAWVTVEGEEGPPTAVAIRGSSGFATVRAPKGGERVRVAVDGLVGGRLEHAEREVELPRAAGIGRLEAQEGGDGGLVLLLRDGRSQPMAGVESWALLGGGAPLPDDVATRLIDPSGAAAPGTLAPPLRGSDEAALLLPRLRPEGRSTPAERTGAAAQPGAEPRLDARWHHLGTTDRTGQLPLDGVARASRSALFAALPAGSEPVLLLRHGPGADAVEEESATNPAPAAELQPSGGWEEGARLLTAGTLLEARAWPRRATLLRLHGGPTGLLTAWANGEGASAGLTDEALFSASLALALAARRPESLGAAFAPLVAAVDAEGRVGAWPGAPEEVAREARTALVLERGVAAGVRGARSALERLKSRLAHLAEPEAQLPRVLRLVALHRTAELEMELPRLDEVRALALALAALPAEGARGGVVRAPVAALEASWSDLACPAEGSCRMRDADREAAAWSVLALLVHRPASPRLAPLTRALLGSARPRAGAPRAWEVLPQALAALEGRERDSGARLELSRGRGAERLELAARDVAELPLAGVESIRVMRGPVWATWSGSGPEEGLSVTASLQPLAGEGERALPMRVGGVARLALQVEGTTAGDEVTVELRLPAALVPLLGSGEHDPLGQLRELGGHVAWSPGLLRLAVRARGESAAFAVELRGREAGRWSLEPVRACVGARCGRSPGVTVEIEPEGSRRP